MNGKKEEIVCPCGKSDYFRGKIVQQIMEYTVRLNSKEDYRVLRKLLKAFDGATITPVRERKSSIELSLEEARQGKVEGPFYSSKELLDNLLG